MKQDDKKKVDVHFPPLFFFISFAVGVDFVSLSREGEGGRRSTFLTSKIKRKRRDRKNDVCVDH
jgi:hypothetical protein